jgi:iron complex outermembrane receptor protein
LKTTISRYGSIACISLMAMTSPVFADSVLDTAAPSDDGAASQVSEVLVTATRRSAPLQSVPVSVGVITADSLEDENLKSVRDLQYLSPSVYVTSANGATISIRGVGTNTTNNGSEQAVGLVVDGVVISFIDDLGIDSLADLDHIEVLRGPQGMLFGKNASAGVISVTTQRPTFYGFSAKAHASFGTLKDSNETLIVNVPISATVAAEASAYFVNRDGFVKDVLLDKIEGDNKGEGGRAKLLWKPDDALDVLLSGDFRHALQGYNFLATWANVGHGYLTYAPGGLGLQQIGVIPSADNTETGDWMVGKRDTHSGGSSVEVNYRVDQTTLTSLTAWRRLTRLVDAPIVSGALDFERQQLTYGGDQFSQEFRITSPTDQRITYVGGLFFSDRDAKFTSLVAGPFGGQGPAVHGPGAELSNVGGKQHVHNVVRSSAVFGEGVLKITDAVTFTAGGRVTFDYTRGSTYTELVPNVYPLPGQKLRNPGFADADETNFSYRLGPQFHFTPNVMGYATFATGYKGPVVDAESSSVVRTVQPETVKSYEVGVKSSLFERRMVLNVAVFDEKFKNFQTSVWEPSLNGFVLGNAGGMRSRGTDVDFTIKSVPAVTLSGGVTYLDAVYTDFKATCYSPLAPIPMLNTTDPSGVGGCYKAPGAGSGFTQAAGFPLNNASKWTYKVAIDYITPLTGRVNFDGSFNYIWRSQFFNVGYDPNTRIAPYGVAGLNIGIASADGKWRVGAFARNLFDKYFRASLASTSLDSGAYTNLISAEARRTVGGSVDFNF